MQQLCLHRLLFSAIHPAPFSLVPVLFLSALANALALLLCRTLKIDLSTIREHGEL